SQHLRWIDQDDGFVLDRRADRPEQIAQVQVAGWFEAGQLAGHGALLTVAAAPAPEARKRPPGGGGREFWGTRKGGTPVRPATRRGCSDSACRRSYSGSGMIDRWIPRYAGSASWVAPSIRSTTDTWSPRARWPCGSGWTRWSSSRPAGPGRRPTN